jgi:predicted XRE-type DNA-binding protein
MERQTFRSVWDALEDSTVEAANMKARTELMIALTNRIESWGLSQAEAAQRIGITQPRLNDLLRGRINKFSLDALVNLAVHAGLAVRIEVSEAA